MKCPTCHTTDLKPTKLTEGLPSFTCSSCEGHFIEILSYRLWSERHKPSAQDTVSLEAQEPTDSKQALVCPQCRKLMTKFMMSDKASNKIDLCTHCGRFWMDGGEWALAKSLNLDTHLTKIFNEPWQKAIRHARTTAVHEQTLKDSLGKDDYEQLIQVRDWINANAQKNEILDYFMRLRAE